MKYISASLSLGIKAIRPKLATLIIIVTMAAALCVAIVTFAQNMLLGEVFSLRVAVVSDEVGDMRDLLDFVLARREIEEFFHVVNAEDMQEANAMLDTGEIQAIIELPTGFVNSVMNGKNLSPNVITKMATPIETAIVNALANGLEEIMTSTQSGIYTVLDHAHEQGLYSEALMIDANLRFVEFFLDRDDVFYENSLEYSETMSLGEHYAILFFMYFIALSTAIFHADLNVKNEQIVYARLRSVGAVESVLYYTKLLAVFMLYFAMTLVYLVALRGEIELSMVICSAVSILLLCAVQAVVFTAIDNFTAAATLSFLLHGFSLVAAGGILPPVMLSANMRSLGEWLPMGAILKMLSFGDRDISYIYLLIILVVAISLLFLHSLLLSKKIGGEKI